MQPYLFPYIGYYQLMHACDRFVVADDVTFIKQGWINRNRLLINGAASYFTVPVRRHSADALIRDVEIDDGRADVQSARRGTGAAGPVRAGMKPIGGFLPLELPPPAAPYHVDAAALASGRACWHAILRSCRPSRVLVPFYICDAVLQPLY